MATAARIWPWMRWASLVWCCFGVASGSNQCLVCGPRVAGGSIWGVEPGLQSQSRTTTTTKLHASYPCQATTTATWAEAIKARPTMPRRVLVGICLFVCLFACLRCANYYRASTHDQAKLCHSASMSAKTQSSSPGFVTGRQDRDGVACSDDHREPHPGCVPQRWVHWPRVSRIWSCDGFVLNAIRLEIYPGYHASVL
jgi:hypothetical protein